MLTCSMLTYIIYKGFVKEMGLQMAEKPEGLIFHRRQMRSARTLMTESYIK